MTSRFSTNFSLFVVAAFLVTACFAFSSPTLSWLALGTGCFAVVIALIGFALRGRGAFQRGLDLCTAAAGGWLIVASRGYGLGTIKWMSFADAALLAGLAAVGLVVYEITRNRVITRVVATAEPGRDGGNGYTQSSHPFNPYPAHASHN